MASGHLRPALDGVSGEQALVVMGASNLGFGPDGEAFLRRQSLQRRGGAGARVWDPCGGGALSLVLGSLHPICTRSQSLVPSRGGGGGGPPTSPPAWPVLAALSTSSPRMEQWDWAGEEEAEQGDGLGPLSGEGLVPSAVERLEGPGTPRCALQCIWGRV